MILLDKLPIFPTSISTKRKYENISHQNHYNFFLLFSLINGQPAFSQCKVGDAVADFTLPEVNGDSISLFDFRSQVILLNFLHPLAIWLVLSRRLS